MCAHAHIPTSTSFSLFECVLIISVIIRAAFQLVLKSVVSERAGDLAVNPRHMHTQ